MASSVLHMTYETVQDALKKSADQRQQLADQLQKINSAIETMTATFQGKAGKSCVNYWNNTGRRHSDNIIQQLEVLDRKLQQIHDLVGENDDACAALFVIQS